MVVQQRIVASLANSRELTAPGNSSRNAWRSGFLIVPVLRAVSSRLSSQQPHPPRNAPARRTGASVLRGSEENGRARPSVQSYPIFQPRSMPLETISGISGRSAGVDVRYRRLDQPHRREPRNMPPHRTRTANLQRGEFTIRIAGSMGMAPRRHLTPEPAASTLSLAM